MSHAATTVSAPGKLLLLGDHAVVHDRPCLVAAIDKRMSVSISQTATTGLTVNAPDLGLEAYRKAYGQLTTGKLPKQVEYVEFVVHEFFKNHTPDCGIEITTSSADIDSRFGFGTSAATLAATVVALDAFFETQFTKKQLFAIAYSALINLKGIGSGADVAASLFGSVQYFVTAGKEMRKLDVQDFTMLVVYSGAKSETPPLLRKVAELKEKDPDKIETLFNECAQLVNVGEKALVNKDYKLFGKHMSTYQDLLHGLGVSTPEIDKICNLAQKAGAYGAKLSGAGGGDSVIVFADNKKVGLALEQAGFETTEVAIASEGTRVEHE